MEASSQLHIHWFLAAHNVGMDSFYIYCSDVCRYSRDDFVNIGHVYKYGRGTCTEKTKICCSYFQENKYCYI